MNRLYWFFRGYAVLTASGASPEWILNNLAEQSVPFWDVNWLDEFTVKFQIPVKHQNKAEQCITRAMCQRISSEKIGALQMISGIIARPVLLFFLVISVLCMSVLPQFVLFFQVVGNDEVPEEAVVRALEEVGVDFGILGVNINPQWIKNHILNMIPQLEWITVTQNGCRAQVVVRERTVKPEVTTKKGLANVVATQSGIITEQSILAGQAMFQVGDTVEKGDMLVSGLVDLERTVAVEHAKAEIYARTWREIQVKTPSVYTGKDHTGEMWRCMWLEIGEKRIKIYGNSGISTGDCDKMSERTNMVLPGGLKLPVTLIVETYSTYTPVEIYPAETEILFRLQEYVRRNVAADMTAGEILAENWDLKQKQSCYTLVGVLECHEMIAASVEVQWDQGGVAHDGAIR